MAPKKRTQTKKSPANAARKRSSAKAAKGGKNESLRLRLTSASPSLTVNDIEKSPAWYRDVLGFTVDQRWESDGKLMGAEMKAGSVLFMIGQDDWKKGRDRVKGVGVRIY